MATNASFTSKSELVTFRCPNELHAKFKAAAGEGKNKTAWLLEAIEAKLIEQVNSGEPRYPFKLSDKQNVKATQVECGLIILDLKKQGKSNAEIAHHLNELKLKSSGGNEWNDNSLGVFYKRHVMR